MVQEQEADEEEEDPDASYPDRPVRRYMTACLFSYLMQYLARRCVQTESVMEQLDLLQLHLSWLAGAC